MREDSKFFHVISRNGTVTATSTKSLDCGVGGRPMFYFFARNKMSTIRQIPLFFCKEVN